MEYSTFLDVTIAGGHIDRGADQRCFVVVGHRPADHRFRAVTLADARLSGAREIPARSTTHITADRSRLGTPVVYRQSLYIVTLRSQAID
jgi:hypothetical protein